MSGTRLLRGTLGLAMPFALALALGCSRTAPDASLTDRPARDAGAAERRAEEARAASAEWDSTYAAGDAAALSELYSDSAVSMPYERPALEGRAAIAADFGGFFADYTSKHRTQILELEVTDDWAIERGRYEMSSIPRGGGPVIGESGKHIVIRHLEDDEWKIRWEIWNLDTTRTP